MRGQKIVTVLLVILFLIVGATIGGGLYFYKEYKNKTEYFEQQNRFTKRQLEQLDRSLNNFKLSLEELTSQFKDYVKNLDAMEDKLSSSLKENKNILSVIGEMREKMQNWEQTYTSSLDELKDKIENLRAQVGLSSKVATKEVELGEISVEKE